MELSIRPRRLRSSDTLRRMVRETRVSPESLIYPLFIVEGENIVEPIPSLDGQWRYSPDRVCEAVAACRAVGVNKVLLFGIPAHKDACGSEAWNPDGVVQQGIRAIKAQYPDCYVITDVCMCEYTDHGHCGILCGHSVDNDKTLEVLSKTALSHVQAAADMVAPSDMMDGRVAAIRRTLDDNGFEDVQLKVTAAAPAFRSDPHSAFARAVVNALRGLYGEEPALHYSMDGTSPMHVFCKQQNIPAAMFGATSDRSLIHAPNEHLTISSYIEDIKIIAAVMNQMALED